MEGYNFPDQGLADMYLIQGVESKPQFTSHFEQFDPMYNEGVSDYFVDQGMYYPTATATNYGYMYTGLESTGEWEDPRLAFGLGGQEIQYPGTINENMPYVYYNSDYGYGQYPYNPYNPYIPGAIIGVDGSIVGPQQYYDVLSYESPASSSAYAPVAPQPRLDSVANGMASPFIDNRVAVKKNDGLVAKHNVRSYAPNSSNSSMPGVGVASVRRNSYGTMVAEGARANIGSGKQPRPSDSLRSQPSPSISQERGTQGSGLREKPSWGGSQLKSSFTSANGLSDFESRNPGMASVHKVKPKILYDERVSHDVLNEHNRALRPNKPKGQLIVKAFTKKAGNPDAQGNIVISTDDYNKVDFPIDYKNAKFFVIKSYSEDDVHKSIKYNVWSSTPNGNRKLSGAYEDAQRIAAGDPRGCPIFLFFSVNASGQFCGLAEMIGPVDFNRDMDFWQQDKWSGSFPVKWHFVKDLPNPNFRHIILENNENKPVTNSRDTQEISYGKGLEMLKIYKNHTIKTSLLDDFLYYENRQRIMQEERARLLIKNYENPYPVPFLDPPRKLQSNHDSPSDGGARNNPATLTAVYKHKVSTEGGSAGSANKQHPLDANNTSGRSLQVKSADEVVDELKMSSLSISSGPPESGGESSTADGPIPAKSEPINFVTIGSMPVNVNGHEGSGVLTVGTIPLDPRALQRD